MLGLVKSGRWSWEEIIQEKEYLRNSRFDIYAISNIFDTLVELIHEEVVRHKNAGHLVLESATLSLNLGVTLISCAPQDKSVDLSKPQIPLLPKEDDTCTHLIWMVLGIK